MEFQKFFLQILSAAFLSFFTVFCLQAQTYTFTNAGALGNRGPTQAAVDSSYSGTSLAGQVNVVGSGIQEWQVPFTGWYLIEVYGAGFNESVFQRGAYMSGEFFIQTSQTLSILVGQMGESSQSGSGGSFVVEGNTPLIIAAGAGGQAENRQGVSNIMGDTGTAGQNSIGHSTGLGHGGVNGSGGGQGGSCFAQSGAGFSGNGVGCDSIVAQSFLNGGVGAISIDSGGDGGFGSGGSGRITLSRFGGGGGYSGGSSAGNTINAYAGGGGSFNSGTNRLNIPGEHAGHGVVIISALTSGAMNDMGVISVDSPNVFCPGTENVAVKIKNFGVNQVTSVDVHWTVNGQMQPAVNFAGSIDTIGGVGNSEAIVNLGAYLFSSTAYDLAAWTSNPNNSTDTVDYNDTVSAAIQSNLPPPTGLAVSNIGGDSTTLSWLPGNRSSNFIYSIVSHGSPPSGGIYTTSDTVRVGGLIELTDYEFFVREVCSNGSDTSAWSNPASFKTLFYSPSNAFIFNNAGAAGANGPTQPQINAEYATGNLLHNSVTSSNGIQIWEVPVTGLYRISAYGASGGFSPGNLAPAGLGAKMTGEMSLVAGDTLLILVGQEGQGVPNFGGTGGGGSFVTYIDSMPLIVAGGGGGAPTRAPFGNLNGRTINRGPYGGSGTHFNTAAAGGGFRSDGSYNNNVIISLNGKAFINGGQGGISNSAEGGFGGGGSTDANFAIIDGAGGGGFSGGDNSFDAIDFGGGGSFNLGANQINVSGVNEGDGAVIIEILPTPVCVIPSKIQAENITSNSLDLTWQEIGSAGTWEVEYGLKGFQKGTGTRIITSTIPVSFTGLNLKTEYDFYVRSICGTSDTSGFIGPVTAKTLCASLSGAYTVGNAPTADFLSFNSAVDVLESCGISGPVQINVLSGTYNEQVSIGEIPGAVTANDVVFKGVDPHNTILTYEQNQSDENYTVLFESAVGVTFDSLTIEAQSTGTYRYAVLIDDSTTDLTIKNCRIISDSTVFTQSAAITTRGNSHTNATARGIGDIVIENNLIVGGDYGVRLNGTFNPQLLSFTISENIFQANNWGVSLSNTWNLVVSKNHIHLNSAQGTGFGRGIALNQLSNFEVEGNVIQGMKTNGIYVAQSFGTANNRSTIKNNSIGGGFVSNNPGTVGIFISGSQSAYIDVFHNTVNMNSSNGRAFRVQNSPSNIRVLNNIFANTASGGNGYAMYVENRLAIQEIDYNNYFTGGNNFVYYGNARADLTALQSTNYPVNNDSNSLSMNPSFTSGDLLVPIKGALSYAGTPLTEVPTDINGMLRDTLEPSMGAYEFTGVDNDVILNDINLSASDCNGNNDSIYFTVTNNFGSTIDFSVNSLTFHWEVSGPVISTGTVIINSDSLTKGSSIKIGAAGVDLSKPGNYEVTLAYIDTNTINQSATNDTLKNHFSIDISAILQVSPRIDTVSVFGDSLDLSATTSLFYTDDLFFSEICQNRNATTGAPSSWPTWLPIIDYVEITGVPNSNLDGITLEQWTLSGLVDSFTFPQGTVLGPNGTAIIRIGSGIPYSDPSNYLYDGVGGNASWNSTTNSGKLLRAPTGDIIDAVNYRGSTFGQPSGFPPAAGVTAAHWSGNMPSASGTAGIRLQGPYTKDATHWVVSSTLNPQNPAEVNSNVTVPGNLSGFSWSFQSKLLDTNLQINVGSFTVPGTYQYVAEYANTICGTLRDTATVEVSFINVALQSAQNISCNGSDDGEIIVSATGGKPPYTFNWSDDSNRTAAMAQQLSPGNYVVTIYDANGAADTVSVILTEPPPLNGTLEVKSSTCGFSDGELTLIPAGGMPPYNYTWSTGGASNVESGLSGGTFSTVTLSDSNGCLFNDSAVVPDSAAPDVTISINNGINCFGGTSGELSAQITGGTPPYNYAWNTNTSGGNLIGVQSGNYSLTVTDSLNCVSFASVFLSEPDSFEIEEITTDHVSCNGLADGAVQLILSGGIPPYTYLWNNAQNVPSLSNISQGTYSVTVTDSNGCRDSVTTITVNEPATALSAVVSANDVKCNGNFDGQASVNAFGGIPPYNYSWSNMGTGSTQLGLFSGSYTVTVTDSNHCQDTQSVFINEPQVIQPTLVSSLSPSCAGATDGEVTISASGGISPYVYAWNNAGSGATQNGLAAGHYIVSVTDSNNCFADIEVTVTEPTALQFSLVNNQGVSCNGGTDAEVTVGAQGATPPYTYQWSNNQSGATQTGLSAGSYFVTISDSNHCELIESVVVSEPTQLSLQPVSILHEGCVGASDGEVTVTGMGGTPPYSYLWADSTTNNTLTGLSTGNYFVTVADDKGCMYSSSVFVWQLPVVETEFEFINDVSCFGAKDGTARVKVTGGTPHYSYAWSNNYTSRTPFGLSPGLYTVTVTDSRGCQAFDSVDISEPSPLSLNFQSVHNATCFGYHDGVVQVQAAGGIPPYSYDWSSGGSSPSAAGLSSGTHHVTVTDDNQCAESQQVYIDEPDRVNTYYRVIFEGALEAEAQGANVTYQWLNCLSGRIVHNATSRRFEPENNGHYALVITIDGCQDTSSCYELTRVGVNFSSTNADFIKLYPNPNYGTFQILLKGNTQSPVQIEILDIKGRLLEQRSFRALTGERNEIFNLNLASGVYLVKVLRDGELSIKQMVVR